MASKPPPEALLFLGEVMDGRFEVQDFIAPGGFGFVFEALDRQRGQQVAVKILQLGVSASAALEFEGEVEILELMNGASSVVSSFGSGAHQLVISTAAGVTATVATQYVALELAEACLVELVVHRNRLTWEERLKLFRGVVRGVHQMHLQKIVHRDLKSENVLLFPIKGGAEAKVSDFGRSRILTRKPRFSADDYLHGRGDLRFAPPELLWLQGVDNEHFWRRIDLYQLGSILFELGTGQGITSLAVGNPAVVLGNVIAMKPVERARHFAASLPALRTRFDFAYSVFSQEVPATIRYEALRLLGQLCDPDPVKREPRRLPGSGSGATDLQWIIRRVDILLLLLAAPVRRRGDRRKAV